MLHADADLAVAVERPVEAHDIRRVALMENLQLPYDLVPDGRFDLQVKEVRKQVRLVQGYRALEKCYLGTSLVV